MLDFLPVHLKKIIKKFDINNVYELRLRKNSPLSLCVKGNFIDLDYVVSENDVADVINNCCNYSVYSYVDCIRRGFVTSSCGERIGLGGQFVYDCGEISTVKNFSSVCIRIPHSIKNSADKILRLFENEEIKNILIISPPGMGKTTTLRNISYVISDKLNKNVVIVDEKNEICSGFSCDDYGKHTDVLSGVRKNEGVSYAVKNLRPDVIITDEISSFDDYFAIYDAIYSGVNVICSLHAYDFDDFLKKRISNLYLKNAVFDYYAVISEKVGNVKNIYSYKGEKID